jgi:hypothetical protein
MRRVTVSFLIAVVLSIVSCGSSGNAKDGGVDAPLDREARSESSLEDAREDGGAPPVDAGSDVGPESSSPSCAGMAAGKCAGCCIASFGDGHTVFSTPSYRVPARPPSSVARSRQGRPTREARSSGWGRARAIARGVPESLRCRSTAKTVSSTRTARWSSPEIASSRSTRRASPPRPAWPTRPVSPRAGEPRPSWSPDALSSPGGRIRARIDTAGRFLLFPSAFRARKGIGLSRLRRRYGTKRPFISFSIQGE